MYCSLPTFQEFLSFFPQTSFTFLPAVLKLLKLQKIPAHFQKEHRMEQLLDTQFLILGRSYYVPELLKVVVPYFF